VRQLRVPRLALPGPPHAPPEQHLHFRQIDIGTVSVLVSAWYPNIEYPRQTTNHRALADVHASLEELRYYCQHAFKVDLSKLARPRKAG